MAVAMVLFYFWGSNGWAEAERHARNVSALRDDTTKKASILTVTRAELKKEFSAHAELISEYEENEKVRVKQAHFISYLSRSSGRDTIDRPVFPEKITWAELSSHDSARAAFLLDSLYDVYDKIEATTVSGRISHPCIDNFVSYNPATGVFSDSLVVECDMQIFVARETPELWFWKLKWRKSKWPLSTRVETHCGWEIKENFIFDLE